MSYGEMGRVMEPLRLSPREKLVAQALPNHHNDELGKAWPSQDTLCAVNGLSRSSVDHAVRDLKRASILSVTKERGERAKYAHNVYLFNHASPGDVNDVGASGSDETVCQKQPKPCVHKTHHRLSTLTDPLGQKPKKKNSSGPQKTTEQL